MPYVAIGGSSYRLEHSPAGSAPACADAFLRRFNEVFGQAKDQAWLDWKYRRNSALAVSLLSAEADVVANWSGFPRTLLWQGADVAAVQAGDVLVVPSARAILSRRGPLFQVSRAFLDRYVAPAAGPYAVAFGFPNLRHMRLLEKLDLFTELFEMRRLRLDAEAVPHRPWYARGGWLHEWPAPAELERSWRAMRRSLADAVVGERSAAYLHWRYAEHPEYRYRIFRFRPPLRTTATFLVVREIDGELHLSDVIGPRQSLRAAVRALLAELPRMGRDALYLWASPDVEQWLDLPHETSATGAHFAYANCARPPLAQARRQRWFLLAGDTDFL